MKKIILTLLCVFVLLLSYSTTAYADGSNYEWSDGEYKYDGDTPDNVVDDIGRTTNGWFYVNYYSFVSRYYYEEELNVNADYMYLTLSGLGSLQLCMKNGSYTKTWSFGSENDIWNRTDVSDYTLDGENSTTAYSSSNSELLKMYTNIPIFNEGDTEAIEAYINEGSTDGALNDESMLDETIECPQDITITNGSKMGVEPSFFLVGTNPYYDALKSYALSFKWYQSCDTTDLSYYAQIRFKIGHMDGGITPSWDDIHTRYVSEWFSLNADTGNPIPYNGLKTGYRSLGSGVTFNLYERCRENLGLSSTNYPYTPLCGIYVRVRNVNSDGYYSKWTYFYINFEDGTADGWTDDDNDADDDETTEDDGNDIIIEDTEEETTEDNDPYDGDDDTTDNDFDVDFDDDDFGYGMENILQFIKEGFLLLSGNGIIALMAALFQYVPAWIWVLIGMSVSINILIMVIGLLKKLLIE